MSKEKCLYTLVSTLFVRTWSIIISFFFLHHKSKLMKLILVVSVYVVIQ
jgi:hypothetical protein